MSEVCSENSVYGQTSVLPPTCGKFQNVAYAQNEFAEIREKNVVQRKVANQKS